jgi:hypothetical protein
VGAARTESFASFLEICGMVKKKTQKSAKTQNQKPSANGSSIPEKPEQPENSPVEE